MALRPKVKRKQKKPKDIDPYQSERFIEAARKLGVDESGKSFIRAFDKIVPPKRPPQSGS
jgi:hypothetical protein